MKNERYMFFLSLYYVSYLYQHFKHQITIYAGLGACFQNTSTWICSPNYAK